MIQNKHMEKQTVRDFIRGRLGTNRNLAALPDFWVEDCINHAAPPPEQCGT